MSFTKRQLARMRKDEKTMLRKPDTLPARLRAVRHLRGLSQQDVADLLKTSRNTVTRWEGGTMSFHPAMREKVEAWIAYWKGEK